MARPLTRDISAGRAPAFTLGGVAIRSSTRDRKVAGTRVAALAGDWERGRVGFWWSVAVLVSRFDCRIRQAARGPSRSGDEESQETLLGLASPRESVGEVKERRKPDRRWQSREIGGGTQQTRIARAVREGHLSRKGALDRVCRPPLTRERQKRSWPSSPGWRATRASEINRRPVDDRKSRPQGDVARKATPGAPAREAQGRVRIGRSWQRAVKRASIRGRIAERRSGAVPEHPVSVGGYRAVPRSAPRRVRDSEVERTRGARGRVSVANVGEEASSSCPRGEPRGEPR